MGMLVDDEVGEEGKGIVRGGQEYGDIPFQELHLRI